MSNILSNYDPYENTKAWYETDKQFFERQMRKIEFEKKIEDNKRKQKEIETENNFIKQYKETFTNTFKTDSEFVSYIKIRYQEYKLNNISPFKKINKI